MLWKLSRHPNFIGVKEYGGNETIDKLAEDGILSWTANDADFHDGLWNHKCHGVISETANVLPVVMRDLMNSENPELAKKVLPVMRWLSEEPNPIGINTLVAMTGVCEPVFRGDQIPRSSEDMSRVEQLVADFRQSDFANNRPKARDDFILKSSNWDTGLNINVIKREEGK